MKKISLKAFVWNYILSKALLMQLHPETVLNTIGATFFKPGLFCRQPLFLPLLLFIGHVGFAQSTTELDSLRNIAKQISVEDSGRARALVVLADKLAFNAPDSSLQLADEALKLSERIEWQPGVVLALRQKGVIYYYQSDFIQAIAYSQKALKAGEGLKNNLMDASIYANLANVYADMNDADKALYYYNILLSTARQIHAKKYEMIALANIASIYSESDNYSKAIDYYRAALPLSFEVNDVNSRLLILSNIGTTLKNSGDKDAALIYLQRSVDLADSIGAKYSKAATLISMADIYLDMKQYETAKQFCMEALQLAKEGSYLSWQADAYKKLSLVYKTQKKGMQALEAYENYTLLRDSVLNDEKKQEIFKKEVQFEADKKQALAQAEINKQKVIRNVSIGAGIILVLAAATSFVFYKRRRDAEAEKNKAELKIQITDVEMKALRAQMNPHFIFNSLNSIADYIDKHETKTASEFTAKFAKLMRMVLENSEHREIPLADDLKALELYMQLERFRLNNKFDYAIHVAENIDKENVLVPPLILQPFVENSIWHGIAKKEGRGNIAIHIRQQHGMINCIVEDDGAGIAEAKIAGKENKSLGMRITKERIAIINKVKNANASMSVFNKDKGVKAEVNLPLELSF